MPEPKIQLLLTGNEIMSGDTVDSNSAVIGQRLAELDLTIYRKVTVGDDIDLLQAELADMSQNADLVIINGGLGPTVDDLTAEVLAAVAGVPITEHPQAIAHLQDWCGKRRLPLNAANLKQAQLPEGCTIIDNPSGSAVGFALKLNDCQVICTPGVPSELKAMLDQIVDQLSQQLHRSTSTTILRLQTFGLGESNAQQLIADYIPNWPADVDLGFRAGAPQMEIKLTTRSEEALQASQHCLAQIHELFGDHIIGEGNSQLAVRVLELLQQRGQTLTVAESCTGGLIASMLTRVPGASDSFKAGFVTYSNHMKETLLGVNRELLAEQGAVSEEVVVQMAAGALARAEADYAVAVSGIAGPDGGTPEKPVGTVWMAWGDKHQLQTRRLRWPFGRAMFQTMTAASCLDMIRRTLLGIETEPRYFSQRRA